MMYAARLGFSVGRFAKVADLIAENECSGVPIDTHVAELRHIFDGIISEPMSHDDVVELTGPVSQPSRKPSDRGAWIVACRIGPSVVGVTCKLVHQGNQRGKFSPLVDQLGFSLGADSHLREEAELRKLISENTSDRDDKFGNSTVDVVAIDGREIWLMGVEGCTDLRESVMKPLGPKPLFGPPHVFATQKVPAKQVRALREADVLVRRAFPEHRVRAFFLLVHPQGPDFELFELKRDQLASGPVSLLEVHREKSSFDFQTQIEQDESFTSFSKLFADDRFQAVPPCRNGRTLQLLAALARDQLRSEQINVYTDERIRDIIRDHYGRIIERDKLRHDVEYHLERCGALEAVPGGTIITVRGIARHFFCLRKYVSSPRYTVEDVIECCVAHQARLMQST